MVRGLLYRTGSLVSIGLHFSQVIVGGVGAPVLCRQVLLRIGKKQHVRKLCAGYALVAVSVLICPNSRNPRHFDL